ncbi:protein SERAC1 [Aplysia californica]|uniref:Protein SERAC1 n=1 Tax=Aplysia californica TaxID=6500 RepID=A0ABM0JNW1_APLCA|nr:protein SERAC1 [Aplysia californica]
MQNLSLHQSAVVEPENCRYRKWRAQLGKMFQPTEPVAAFTDFEEWFTFQYVSFTSARDVPWGDESEAGQEKHFLGWLFPWELSKSDNPWVLLQLTKSTNFWIRQMGVASLASKLHWEDYKYRGIAQACEPRTTVALARYPSAKDAFFLPPPRLHDSQRDVLLDLKHQLSQLPVPNFASSISYFRTIALDPEIMFQRDPVTMDMDVITHMYTLPGEDEKKRERKLTFCLEAVLAYTAVQEYALQFVENHGLSVLQRLQQVITDSWVQIYIASILANLSQCPSLLDIIVQTGWVYILRQWAASEDAFLSLLALTTLANLDQDWTSHDFFQDMILIHPTQRNSKPAKADIVFVHGLRGGAVRTWRQKDNDEGITSQCWPKDWLAADCPHIRILSIGYNSSLHRWGDYCPFEQDKRTLEGRGHELMKKLKQAGVGSRPIIWVGHSMGGLLIKQILALSGEDQESSDLKSNTKGIVMYSVPHHGSAIVDAMMYAKYLLFPSVEVQELLTTSPRLSDLHDQFLNFMTTHSVPLLSFGENAKTAVGRPLPKLLVVPPGSSDPGFGKFVSLPVNHINTCKPHSENDISYQLTVAFIKGVIDRLA